MIVQLVVLSNAVSFFGQELGTFYLSSLHIPVPQTNPPSHSQKRAIHGLGPRIHRTHPHLRRGCTLGSQMASTVSTLLVAKSRNEADYRRIIGGLIAKHLHAHEIIFNTLLPVAQQRIDEKALADLGQKVPKHVRDPSDTMLDRRLMNGRDRRIVFNGLWKLRQRIIHGRRNAWFMS
jgi:hypothetical protein